MIDREYCIMVIKGGWRGLWNSRRYFLDKLNKYYKEMVEKFGKERVITESRCL